MIFVKGLIVGLVIAAPLGPVGLLCVQRSLANGYTSGIIAGLGAATADAFCGIIAVFGLAALAGFLAMHHVYSSTLGGVILFLFGLKVVFDPPKKKEGIPSIQDNLGGYSTSFFLTFTNPITLIALTAIFAWLGLEKESNNYMNAITLVAGIFFGSIFWWILLSSGATYFKSRISTVKLHWTNRILGLLLVFLGVFCLTRGLRGAIF
ncbi:MAG: LysE family translocator [Planctomycetota bacterium]|jgi:threonine/homoserine/homoserine lactone efflux protein